MDPQYSPASAAFFCPQTKAADEAYLDNLHAFMSSHAYGKLILDEVAALGDTQSRLWETFASAREDVRALGHGPKCLAMMRDWATNGISKPLTVTRSNILSLPLLAVLQIGQYLRYLEIHGLSHQDFVADVKAGGGGVHGYCGGQPAAICLSCAADEAEIVQYMGATLRILVGVGAFTEAGDPDSGAEPTLLALRIKHEGQGDEIVRRFPGTYISAITAPRSVSIGGPASVINDIFLFASDSKSGLRAEKIDLGGTGHNPGNLELAAELCRICRQTPGLQLPDASRLQMPVRSNRNGAKLVAGDSLADDLITAMVASRCEWYQLLRNVADDLKLSSRTQHGFVVFGWMDCVTMTPFHQARLQVTKSFVKDIMQESSKASTPDEQNHLGGKSPTQEQETSDQGPDRLPDNTIAVIGAACRFPGANNMSELWDLVANATSTVRELPAGRFNPPAGFRLTQNSNSFPKGRTFYGNFLDDVKRFDHSFFGVSAREAANMDPQQRLMLELSVEALDDAGYLVSHQRTRPGDNVGCFLGLVSADYLDNANAHPPTAYTSTGTVPAFMSGRVSHAYGWTGPSEMVNTACSSSMVAMNRACKAIQMGECRMAIAGGANIMTGVNNYLDLGKAGFLSPTGQCKPFDASADGYCRAEGAGLVVLKPLKDALADGDAIWGVIPGIGTNHAGMSVSLTVPDPDAQQALYRSVLQQSGIAKDQVSYVEAHGTGTRVGDPLEMESIRSVFGCDADASSDNPVYIGSIKGNIGHCEPAAGVAGLLKILTMLWHKHIPPQASFQSLNPQITPKPERHGMAISRSLHSWNPKGHGPFRAALVNSYGATGSNGALLCCDWPASRSQPRLQPGDPDIVLGEVKLPLLVTAKSKTSLLENARAIGEYLSRSIDLHLDLPNVAFTLNQRRQRHRHYISIEADSVPAAARLLKCRGPSDLREFPADVTPPGPHRSRPLVLIFGGQSSSTIALPRVLYDGFPLFRSQLDACDAEYRKQQGPAWGGDVSSYSLLDAIFQTSPITDPALLQCGVFAVQYASARCWINAGAQPAAVVGHSLGELTALAVSGVLSLADSIKLIAARGRVMGTNWGPEKGAMLAVECSPEEFSDINSSALVEKRLEIACFNGPTSLVVAGPVDAIDAAERALMGTATQLRRIRFQRLQNSHAFHSRLTEPVLADLRAIASTLTWKQPTIPLYPCLERAGESNEVELKYDVAAHARQPVFFADAIRRVEDALGPTCVWLEAGFDAPIVAMAKRACRSEKHVLQPVKVAGRSSAAESITDVVTSLWHSGVFLRHWALAQGRRAVWLPPYQFEKPQHWVEHIDRVAEIQQQMQQTQQEVQRLQRQLTDSRGLTSQPDMAAAPPPLVSWKGIVKDTSGMDTAEFVVNPNNLRLRKMVEGHSMRSHGLHSGAVYMECAMAGVLLLLSGTTGVDSKNAAEEFLKARLGVVFEHLDMRAPLGVEPQCDEVILRLSEKKADNQQTWHLAILSSSSSSAAPGAKPREVFHVQGFISLVADPELKEFQGLQRLVSAHIRRVSASDDEAVERLSPNRAYSLFGRVMNYAAFYRGITGIQLTNREAVATAVLPDGQPYRNDRSGGVAAWKVCDAVLIECLVHIVGLLINTCEEIPDSEVAMLVHLDRAILSPAFSAAIADGKDESKQRYTVYCSFEFAENDEKQDLAVGDVYVISAESNKIVATFAGVRMQRLRVDRLAKLLNMALLPKSTSSTRAVRDVGVSTTSTKKPPMLHVHDINNSRGGLQRTSSDTITTGTDGLSSNLTSIAGVSTPMTSLTSHTERKIEIGVADEKMVREKLRDLVAECTGIDPPDITDDTAFSLLGLDSLGSAELSEELSSKLGLSVASEDLPETTMGSLLKLLGTGRKRSTDGSHQAYEHAIPYDNGNSSPHHTILPKSENHEVYRGSMDSGYGSGNAYDSVQLAEDPSRERFLNILTDVLGAEELSGMELSTRLGDLGMDSLSLIDLKQELHDAFGTEPDVSNDSTVQELVEQMGLPSLSVIITPSSADSFGASPVPKGFENEASFSSTMFERDPLVALKSFDAQFDSFARKHKTTGYWKNVAPYQDEVFLAYVVEALAKQGVDFRLLSAGDTVRPVSHLTPKYDKLMARLWESLARHGIVNLSTSSYRPGETMIKRSSQPVDFQGRSPSQLLEAFDKRFPAYRAEAQLLGLTGPRLADCLSGRIDSIALMFGSAESAKIVEDYHADAPFSAAMIAQLVAFIKKLVEDSHVYGTVTRPVRILEAGAGMGGTTRQLAAALDSLPGVRVEYTFTDIAPSLVKKAKAKFEPRYPWMTFTTFNLDESVPLEFVGHFDFVIATNTVHATMDRRASCRRMRETLNPAGGLIVLAELTAHLAWMDICFGLLDGWWLADGPMAPLQTAEEWMNTFVEAGFASMAFSSNDCPEARTAQVLVGSNNFWPNPMSPPLSIPGPRPMPTSVPPVVNGYGKGHEGARGESNGNSRLQTVVYKEVDDVQIHADIYYPKQRLSSSSMPIALMIHGGGHMTLSRRAIRPAQTRFLLKQGFLPVSIDYRLCPEVNLVDGPMSDVCDAYRWARLDLPRLVATTKLPAGVAPISVDATHVVVVGWSTGGQLAMSLAWTAPAAGLPPPSAVLSFYSPVDFESGELDKPRFMTLPKPEMKLDEILPRLASGPVTNHASSATDTSNLGWVCAGDARSELLLTVSREGTALPVLLNGLDYSSSPLYSSVPKLNTTAPSPARIASISPLARLLSGQYNTPTFIVHGTEDEVAPFGPAERFVTEMRARELPCGLLPLKGQKHIFDLGIEEGMEEWDELVAPGYRFLCNVVRGVL